jgi:S1/P1 nuclease
MRTRSLLWLAALPLFVPAYGWNDTGHMVTGAIAYARLDHKAKTEADRLLKIGSTETTSDFMTACVWADDIRRTRRETGPWHYIDYHFRSDGKPTPSKPDAENVETALAKFTAILKDPSQPDADRADALRFIMHFVGDSHQPLHAVSRDSDAMPDGDKGGNAFMIIPPAGLTPQPKNLHSLWDQGCGLFNGTRRPLSEGGVSKIQDLASSLTGKYADEESRAAKDLDPTDWTHESLKLAQTQVYSLQEGSEPSEEYLEAGRITAGKRIVLAGLRMANLLNKLIG